jgi:hypothetical protein
MTETSASKGEKTAMKSCSCSLTLLGLIGFALGWHQPAEAAYQLSFNSSSYVISSSQPTVPVQVFLSQTAGGIQISPGNPLLTTGILVSFNNPSGVAAVLSTNNITANPAFDSSSSGVTSTQASLAETSLLGISSLPVLLGTFTFSPLKARTTQISVATLSPGSSFSSLAGVLPDPSPATATITVVPEPSSLLMALTGSPLLLAALVLRRRTIRWPTRLNRKGISG